MILPKEFYTREDTLSVAKDLLGKYLFTALDGKLTGGMIVETEAYIGPLDAGSHAFNNRRTTRNETMYAEGGVTYMYICYGIHDMLNVVTGAKDSSHAVLIRAVEPRVGIDIMQQRRGENIPLKRLCSGPGALARAFGLKKIHDGMDMSSRNTIWIEDQGTILSEADIKASGRVGLGCSEPYFSIPWRFYIDRNSFVSRGPKAKS